MEATHSTPISNHGLERWKLLIQPPLVIMEEMDGSYLFYLSTFQDGLLENEMWCLFKIGSCQT